MSILSLFHAGVMPTLTLNNSGTFTWTKPNNVTNKDAVRDFTVTYYAFLDTNGNGKLDAGEITGGRIIKDYTTTDSIGKVTELTFSDFSSSELSFYYVDISTASSNLNGKYGKAQCNMHLSYTLGSGTYYEYTGREALYYVETPTVNYWGATGVSVDLIILEEGEPPVLGVSIGSPESYPGIVWEGEITAQMGGGHIVSAQLGTSRAFAYLNDGDYANPHQGIITGYDVSNDYGNNLLLDGSFPYTSKGIVNSTTHKASLTDDDSPFTPLAGFKSFERHDFFETYLMYMPDGVGSIYVPLSVFSWSMDFKGKIVVENGTTRWKFEGARDVYADYPIIATSNYAPNKLPEWNYRLQDYIENL